MEPARDEIVKKLFEKARERLLRNMPLLAHASESGVGALAMSAGAGRLWLIGILYKLYSV
jgi:hypothetical protein